MRADRLISLVLLLRRNGRMTAPALARELEVSTRTVLRDIEALSSAGVPVYSERGRHGGFALLNDFRTELSGLTGLTHEEALALLAAGSTRGEQVFGLGPALASGLRKVLDALPDSHRSGTSAAARRFHLDPDTDLLARRLDTERIPDAAMREVRHAVLAGRKVRIHYAAVGQDAAWRTVDPIGLVTAAGRSYLLATRSGADRTYRLSRIRAAEALSRPADRTGQVDLDRLWRQRSASLVEDGDRLTVLLRVSAERKDEVLDAALGFRFPDRQPPDPDGWLRLEATFQDAEHAHWVLWRLAPDAEALGPPSLRAALHTRALGIAARYGQPPPH
ncbi:WYL domain-containing protein [Streptomyces sp. NPDC029526]|uniref:helix-turn-helix transcriptional regulator n=1 Tax=Streptomyces sp. NPDC029526 TaxID=3155728 RepID=UPI0033C32D06